jgi:hypothetical protein
MRILETRESPLNFGKHKGLDVKQIADEHPRYFVWLWKDKVISFSDKKDQSWFSRKARLKRDQISSWVSALIPDRFIDDLDHCHWTENHY